MVKKTPMRTCIVCRKERPKRELLRIVKTADGIKPDLSGRLAGRGAYVCADENCIAGLKKSKALNRAFSCQIDEKVYEEIAEGFRGTKE